jgi:hypothetical protein
LQRSLPHIHTIPPFKSTLRWFVKTIPLVLHLAFSSCKSYFPEPARESRGIVIRNKTRNVTNLE